MKKNGVLGLLVLLYSLITSNAYCVLGDSWHFNTKEYLNSPKKVRIQLAADAQTEGYTYKEVEFHPINNEKKVLKGIFIERPNARATIVCTPGFWPGLKEPLAPLVKIMPKDCNLFFIELTNHGQSGTSSCFSSAATCLTPSACLNIPSVDSCLQMSDCLKIPCFGCMDISLCKILKFLGRLKTYGLAEHFDIMGALQYTAEKTNRKPIVLFGWCAGAFLSARTLIKLKELEIQMKQNFIQMFNIQGLIFDSGFGSLTDMIEGCYQFINKKHLSKLINGQSEQNEGIWGKLKSGLKFLGGKAANMLLKALEFWVRPALEKNKPETNLYDKIAVLADLPIYVIHAKNDMMAKWEQTQKLVENMQNKELWLIENSSHAKNHLKHKDEYHIRMVEWLDKTVSETPVKNKPTESNPIIQQMIRLIDQMIHLLEHPTEKAAQEFQTLLQQFGGLLENTDNGLSEKTKVEIAGLLQHMPKVKSREQVITILRAIKKLLRHGTSNTKLKKQTKTKSPTDNPNGKGKRNNNVQNPSQLNPIKNTRKENNKKKNIGYPASSNKSKTSPSGSRSRYSPTSPESYASPNSNGGYYPSDNQKYDDTPNNGYGSYGNTGGSPMYGGSSGGSWTAANKQNKEEQKTAITATEIRYMDERYSPEMEDQPDAAPRRYYPPHKRYF